MYGFISTRNLKHSCLNNLSSPHIPCKTFYTKIWKIIRIKKKTSPDDIDQRQWWLMAVKFFFFPFRVSNSYSFFGIIFLQNKNTRGSQMWKKYRDTVLKILLAICENMSAFTCWAETFTDSPPYLNPLFQNPYSDNLSTNYQYI